MTSEFTLHDAISIDGSRSVVWSTLTDFVSEQRWPGGSPVAALGPFPLAEGARFHERAKRGPFWANFDLVCTEWREDRVFAWKAKSFGVWGEHRWELRDEGSGTRVLDSERFWGPLPLIVFARLIFPLFGVKAIRHGLLESLRRTAERRQAIAG